MAARRKNRALVLLRRSTDRQEKSLAQQLDWAVAKAAELGLSLDAAQADLEHMQARRLHRYKSLFVDDAVPGSDLARPGLTAMRSEAIGDRSASHLLAYLPDRFARPEEPLQAAMMEIELLKAGITVVFSNRTSLPRQKGVNYFAENIQLLYQYTEAGEYLNILAQRVIDGQTEAAQGGNWTGGRAPYGFARVLVDARGRVVQELPDGMKVRMDGCRVRIKPRDDDKIRTWVMILEWYGNEKLGAKRIARRLNELEIPSPDAGRTRTDNGVQHKVSGSWSARTVLELIRNQAVIGLNRYGVQSEGRHRRLGDKGPRLLGEADTRQDGMPKVVKNPGHLVIARPTGFEPAVDRTLFEICQEQLTIRGESQRGISRRVDRQRYPLALRIWDMTEGCGHPMYARTSGNRSLYVCGRYEKTAGSECHHNAVDGEAALAFVLDVLRQKVAQVGGRAALRRRLVDIAAATRGAGPNASWEEAGRRLRGQLAEAEEEQKLIARNLARARDDAAVQAIEQEFLEQQRKVDRLRREVETTTQKVQRQGEPHDPEREVDRALALYEQLEQVVQDPTARTAIHPLLEKINLKLWLNFGEGQKGKRKIRQLKGGILTTGDAGPPVRPYGGHGNRPACVTAGTGRSGSLGAGANEKPSAGRFDDRAEGFSFRKGSRGERI